MDKASNYSTVNNRIPALRIALTPKCNLTCEYCPPKGENFIVSEKALSNQKLLNILNIFYEIGFRQFGFTGGEPLLNEKLHSILNRCFKFKNIYLKLYTNGILLKRKIEIVKKFDLVKLSLDTLDRKKYEEITGADKLKDVLEGIILAKKNKIRIRLNTVLTQKNYDGIFDLIVYCCRKEIDLKILDLNCFTVPGYSVWRTLYKSPAGITRSLETMGFKKKIIYTVGNYGIPMAEYARGKTHIRIKDTTGYSVYSPICRDCKYFLCQEGLYHLTLTCGGKLKMCRHRPDISIDINHKKNNLDIKNSIIKFLKEHYFPAQRLHFKKEVFLGQFGKRKFFLKNDLPRLLCHRRW